GFARPALFRSYVRPPERPFDAPRSALERAADLAHDVVSRGLDGSEVRDVEERLRELLALFRAGDVDEGVGDLLLEIVVEARERDHAVVGAVRGVSEGADRLLDVRVVPFDGPAASGAGRAADGDGYVHVTHVGGERGSVVRAGEDARHLGIGVDAVLVLQRDVGELVARGRAGVYPRDRRAAEVLELLDPAVTANVELRPVGGAALTDGGQYHLGAVGVHRLHEGRGAEHADVDATGTHRLDQADVVRADEGLDRDEQALF